MYPTTWLSRTALAALFGAILLYGIARASSYVRGPSVTLVSPADGETVRDKAVVLEGLAERIATLTANGRTIFTDEHGNFRERLLLPPGYSILQLVATDRFGRTTTIRRQIVINPYAQKTASTSSESTLTD